MVEISLSLTLNLHVYVPRGPATHISWSGQWLPRKSYGASVFAPALRALNYPGSEKHPWEADVFDTISQSPEKNTPDIDSNHLSEEYENRWCISRIQAWSYWSHEKLRLKVIIVKGREGERAPVPAVPDNLFSLLYSNWSQECWWDQRLLIVSALSASGWAFVLFHFIYFDGREKGSVHATCMPALAHAGHTASSSDASDLGTVLKPLPPPPSVCSVFIQTLSLPSLTLPSYQNLISC